MSQQQNKQDDDVVNYLLIVVLVGVGLWMLWSNFSAYIVAITVEWRSLVLWPFTLVSDDVAAMHARMQTVMPSSMTLDRWWTMLNATGRPISYILILAILFLAYRTYANSYRLRFSKTHSIQSLIEQEQAIWPEISPVVGTDLVSEDLCKGPWATPMHEREFVNHYKLLNEDGSLNKDKTTLIFERQLGQRWRGVEKLPRHAQALFAIFAMRIHGKQDESLAKVRLLARSYAVNPKAIDYSWVDDALKQYGSHDWIKKTLSRHAWNYTILCTMLQLARVEGVFATSLWVWLRTVDRRLFFALNCVGRYTDFVEVGGIMTHWRSEKKFGIGIPYPDVEAATHGLEKALKFFCDDDYLETIFE